MVQFAHTQRIDSLHYVDGKHQQWVREEIIPATLRVSKFIELEFVHHTFDLLEVIHVGEEINSFYSESDEVFQLLCTVIKVELLPRFFSANFQIHLNNF